MKKQKLFFLFPISVLTLPVFAISCNINAKQSSPKINLQNKEESPIYNINKPAYEIKLLSSSQIAEVKDSFSFSLTEEGKKLYNSNPSEIEKILKRIRKKSYPRDTNPKISLKVFSLDDSFEEVKKDNDFKKYFIFQSPTSETFKYLNGHKLEFELIPSDPNKKTPAIKYAIRCPDKIYNGVMSVEDSGFIYLDQI
ncbi:hypothetical protein [Metamycoplasma canadense]|uniref:Lipoprotein n=1 Tax=Metamycoplasma canadense TaxID=29554 RepID=A0A077L6Z1_9BACT|nr:hypothetical protein [Metamycoplasma canadense]BAP39792.1 hypothetical protein MCAN360_0773 [Metamycoplasma canadense]